MVQQHAGHAVTMERLLILFKTALTTGRLGAYMVQTRGIEFMVYYIYGWTGGHDSLEQATRTDDLVQACCAEMAENPKVPTIIAGNINAEVGDLPTLNEIDGHRHWMDGLWWEPANMGTQHNDTAHVQSERQCPSYP